MMMSTTTTTPHATIMPPAMRPVPVQESPVSRPRAVYSIDQILGNQHQSKRSGKSKLIYHMIIESSRKLPSAF